MRHKSFHIRFISTLFFSLLFGLGLLLTGCSQANPTSTPEPATAVPTQAPTQGPTLTPAMSGTGVDIASISIDTQDLPYSWQANRGPGTPYDATQPPGSQGLPEHIQINFGVVDPKDRQPGDPVLYIIPVEAYKRLWDGAGDTAVTQTIDQLRTLLAERPLPPPTSGMPVLPFEELGGFNDLAVQGKYLDTSTMNGLRFVGRFAQGPNPVINEGLRYIFQGFSNDGGHFIAFFYPVTTGQLPMSAADIPDEELARVDSDPEAYLKEKAEMLNGLTDTDWDPNLVTLDRVLASLRFATSALTE